MRIGIEYTAAVRERAGIGRFTRSLVRALASLDSTEQYILLSARDGSRRGEEWPANFTWRWLPLGERAMTLLWHRLRLPLPVEAFAGELDLYHAPDFLLPPLRRARALVTVHDLSFLRYPECAPAELVRYLSQALPRSLERAHLVLADSQSTRDDLVSLLQVPADKVEVVYGGVAQTFHPVTDGGQLEAVKARYHLDGPFLLTVGTLQPRKNLARLLQAYARLGREAGLFLPLVIAGERGWLYQELFSLVARLGVEERVRFVGYVAEEELPALYTLAQLFVFPSLYEGFGLPLLEAMSCGVPVACSNSSSLPEVAGEAALLFDATDVTDMAQAIHRALTEEELRQELRERGFARARLFTWHRSAQKLLTLYHQVGGLAPAGVNPPSEAEPAP